MTFSITTIHHNLPTTIAKAVVGAMNGSFNFRAVAYARMAIRQDAYEQREQRAMAGYKRFSEELNIDDRAEADMANKELAEKQEASKDFGFMPTIPARDMARMMMTLRGFCTDRMEELGPRSERELPQPIKATIQYMLTADPIRDREKLRALAEACEIDFEDMEEGAKLDHETDIKELARTIGQVTSMLDAMEVHDVEDSVVEACFDELPKHVQFKLIAKVISVYEREAAKAMRRIRGGSFDAASEFKMLKAQRNEAVAWLKNFETIHKAALADYLDNGGMLPDFDTPVVTSNKPVERASNTRADESTSAAAARLKEDNDEREAQAASKREPKSKGAPRRAPAPATA